MKANVAAPLWNVTVFFQFATDRSLTITGEIMVQREEKHESDEHVPFV